ncbi:hypothetical protein BJ138DRAFT_1165499 [Hygrophoropsis aurantiaca]|uniref:Uncharacterized protein n=1 Tax=Hygrophoropsis aurantiaca TaxID=72124 RepID=A0ACB7ZWD0_9AGAM|nr:hypothetical protein BJ138DRAFT_1165499 [Hygrophoropsis aurantiaca]
MPGTKLVDMRYMARAFAGFPVPPYLGILWLDYPYARCAILLFLAVLVVPALSVDQ